jgi:diketogulonate reductase-like aldo/keto reductase
MRYEEAPGAKLPKVGFGTWSIGGRETPDLRQDARSLAALRSALMLGYTHFDTAEMYAGGHCEELLGRAMRELRLERSAIFITSKVSAENLGAQQVLKACDASLRRLQTDRIDLYLIHWPNASIPLKATFEGLNRLMRTGKVRHLGVSNFGLGLLKQAEALSDSALLTDQVPMSIFDGSYVSNGVVEYCQSRRILVTAYSPVKHRQVRTDATLAQIAASRGLTPFQVGIAWVCNQPGVITIPMSTNPQHQRDNLDAADTVLTPEELDLLA